MTHAGRARWARRIARALGLLAVLGILVGVGGALWVRARVRGSLPVTEGVRVLRGLTADVRVDRDDRGAVTLTGKTREDVARATGFVHAQDRFFQMDLLRRRAAGELAALFGKAALPLDREVRVHGFRRVARHVVASADPRVYALVEAYTAGVNEGLHALRSKPFEYLLLRAEPEPWTMEDSALVILAMFLDLQNGDGATESALGLVHDLFPAPVAAFLAPSGTEWDAPLEGPAFAMPPVPGPEVFDLRTKTPARGDGDRSRKGATADPVGTGHTTGVREPSSDTAAGSSAPFPEAHAVGETEAWLADLFGRDRAPDEGVGSNSFAVGPSRTADGRTIVASDMHLGLNVPNIWYRMSFVWGDGREKPRHVTGVTLPGTPAMVAGSNGKIAWAFTNSYTDTSDLVVLEPDFDPDNSYRVPHQKGRDGWFERRTETIVVKGAPSVSLEVLDTIWGPVIDKDHLGRRRVLRWVAHDPEAVNFELLRMENEVDIGLGVNRANMCGIPAQNLVVVDEGFMGGKGMKKGIGWTIAGLVPRRRTDGTYPVSWAKDESSWNGWLRPGIAWEGEGVNDYPYVINPPNDCLWTANARIMGGDGLKTLGDGGYVLGARARQIRDDLLAKAHVTEADLAAIQLDDCALFLERWRTLLLEVLDDRAVGAEPRRKEMKAAVASWGGRASVDSVGYRLVRGFRQTVADRTFEPFAAICRKADARFDYRRLPQYEGPLWALVTTKPPHLLDPKYKMWDDLLLASADGVLEELRAIGPRLSDRTWGERNTALIRHPLSRAVPLLGRWLDMPAVPLPGDNHMPRVQAPSFGASERFVVSPGHEEDGLFQMPGGQCGHPLSDHYADGEDDWVQGRSVRFLPGPAVHTLTLRP